jgi:hypothetical protein
MTHDCCFYWNYFFCCARILGHALNGTKEKRTILKFMSPLVPTILESWDRSLFALPVLSLMGEEIL